MAVDADGLGAGDRSVLRRGLSILECFEESGAEQTISSLSGRTGLPPATVHRIIGVLVDWGGIERVGRGRYRLGVRLWRLGAVVPEPRALRDVALPYMEDLYEATHSVVHLAVIDGLETLYIEKISGRQTVAVTSSVGRRVPLYAAGPGKVLLAFSGPELLQRVVAAGLKPRTERTIVNETTLRQVLAEIRKTGFSVSREETSHGTGSIAAPVFDALGSVRASISVVTAPERLDIPMMAPLVTTVARAVTRALARAELAHV